MQKLIELKILDERLMAWGLPDYARPGDAGVDLRACIDEPLYLEPGQTRLVPTGVAIHIGDENLVGLLFPRSGLAAKYGIGLANAVAVIDAGFQGEIKCALHRAYPGRLHGEPHGEPHRIQPGDRIAQLVLTFAIRMKWDVVSEFRSHSVRGLGGFGHSGHQ